ncbi:ion transporter [Nitriliruptor alkaliphilus]|uniref:ion transporter n=1 Tax=Nitriliruptor alkaliphilus TaxID=427918 RepID=UPI000698F12D|nr:ion transporter [Nitriliruptor alkaliphilus]
MSADGDPPARDGRRGRDDPDAASPTLCPDPDDEPSARERTAAVLEERLDIPMAVLAVVWAGLVAYELVAPADQRQGLALVGNAIWGVFALELAVKLGVSGHPLRYLRRRWPSVLFLALPALRVLRVARALRAVRVLPAARVAGASYRAVGTARGLLAGRLQFLAAATLITIFSGGQLLYVLERGRDGGVDSLGDALWIAANAAISGSIVAEPITLAGRLLALLLTAYAVVVFASLAATLGAFFLEARQERATAEDDEAAAGDA